MSFASITKAINEAADTLPNGPSSTPEEQAALIAACDRLKTTIESPLDGVMRILMGTHNFVAVRLGVEMGLFNATVGKAEGTSVQQLASSIGADADLVARIMRMLAGLKMFECTGKDTYTATPFAGAFVSASPLAAGVIHFGIVSETLTKLPGYFAANGKMNPGDAFDGPFQYALGTKQHYFDWMKNEPEQQSAFNSVMQISRLNRGQDWFEFFPVEEKLAITDSNAPLLVDIGGGVGHDLIAFKAKHPNLPGKLILQDVPAVIDDVKEIPGGIELMKHDFFDAQPVKGARAYYLRTVLHDWPDKQARQILANIHKAMDKDSLLLINENVLPDGDIPLYQAQLDLTMMAMFSSLDRSRSQFEELLESAGFKLVAVWTPEKAVMASGTLFEAVKK